MEVNAYAEMPDTGFDAYYVGYNPYAENTWSDLEVELDGDRLPGRVFGRRSHGANVTR